MKKNSEANPILRRPRLSPTLWRTSRALANDLRLRILKELFESPRQTVSMLADHLRIPLSIASYYLRMISARGLLASERKSKWVYYSPGSDPAIAGSSDLLEALRHELTSSRRGTATAFRKLTGFTHPRRIKICRALLAHGALSAADIGVTCRIPKSALLRHLNKLLTRGIITVNDGMYKCAGPKDLLTATLLGLSSGGP